MFKRIAATFRRMGEYCPAVMMLISYLFLVIFLIITSNCSTTEQMRLNNTSRLVNDLQQEGAIH